MSGNTLFKALRAGVRTQRRVNFGRAAFGGISGGLLACLGISTIANESEQGNEVIVSSKVEPFPKRVNNSLLGDNILLGHGVREVSFLKMQVYALGVYVDAQDLKIVEEAPKLEDDSVWDMILNRGVKFTARICAVRNTDMSHLRDGFIRTIRNSARFKKIVAEDGDEGERVLTGLDELRDVFNSYPGKVRKNTPEVKSDKKGKKGKPGNVLWMQTDSNGAVHVFLDDHAVGVVREPLVGALLFERYVGSGNPLVPSVHQTALAFLN